MATAFGSYCYYFLVLDYFVDESSWLLSLISTLEKIDKVGCLPYEEL
jgi:hypothetical protein